MTTQNRLFSFSLRPIMLGASLLMIGISGAHAAGYTYTTVDNPNNRNSSSVSGNCTDDI